MTLVDIEHEPGGYVLLHSPYDEIIKAQFAVAPGIKWSREDRAYRAPLEAARIALRMLRKAKVAKFDEAALSHPQARFDAPDKPLDLDGLREYQKAGARFIVDTASTYGSALLADDMGLGKSVQALRAARCLLPEGRILVVCPAVVQGHWAEQARKWLDESAAFVSKREPEWSGIGVVSYDALRVMGSSKTPMSRAQLIVLDEVHYLSNSKSQRSKITAHYVAACRSAEIVPVIGTSGTPMTTRIRDLWHPLNVLFPERFGTWFKFTERYAGGHFEEIRGVPKPVWQSDGASNLDELHERLSALMLRRERHAVGELPARTRVTIPVDLPASALKQLQRQAAHVTGEQGLSKLLSNIEQWKFDATVNLVSDIVEQGGKVLVFTTKRSTARELSETLKAPYVTGETPAKKRRDILLKGARQCGIGIATMFSVTTGIDLLEFDAAVFVGLDYVPSNVLQAEARIHRIGQHKPVTVYFMVGLRTVDEIIRSTVIERLGYYEQVLGDQAAGQLQADLSGTEEQIIQSIIDMVRDTNR